MLDTSAMDLVYSALDYASTRQEVLANNLANINTPGYRRHDVSFDDVLAQAEGGTFARIANIRKTTRQMFTGGIEGSSSAEIITPDDGAMRVDGNNVDMDHEMATLAQNQLYYTALTQIAANQFSDLKSVIKG